MLDGLKTEIVEAEKARTHLLKWKLIVVAGLAGAGFGLFDSATGAGGNEISHLALCIIPFACLYIDLLCYNLQVRMLVISLFIQNYKPGNGASEIEAYCMYEKFCDSIRSTFKLEDWAMEYSTRVISGLITLSSMLILLTHRNAPNSWTIPGISSLFILTSGLIGIALSMLIKKKFTKKIHKAQKTIHQDMKEACQTCNAVISFIDLKPQ